MKTLIKTVILSLATLGMLSGTAYASSMTYISYNNNRGYDRHHHGRDYVRHDRHDRNWNHRSTPIRYGWHRNHYGFWRGNSFVFDFRPVPIATTAYYTPIQPTYIAPVGAGVSQASYTDDRYCREYQAKTLIGNRTQNSYGTACMQPDGSWEIIN